jgi:hypothetical protein
MPDPSDRELLSSCEREIEERWNDARDDSPVRRLAAAHPHLADELYDFFTCVVEAEDELDQPHPERAEMDRKVREMLRRSGSGDTATPRTFLALVRDTSDRFVDDIAVAMDVTPDFLVDASDNGKTLPLKARAELVRRARTFCDIDEDEGVASFDVSSAHRRAASRTAAYPARTATYADIVVRSRLSDEAKRFWLGLGAMSVP